MSDNNEYQSFTDFSGLVVDSVYGVAIIVALIIIGGWTIL